MPIAAGPVEAHLDPRPAAGGHLLQQRRQLAQLARTDHQVHVRGPLKDLMLVLLSHAAQDADDRFRPLCFELPQPAQRTVDFVFGMLAHTTRIEQDRIGLAGAIDHLVTGLQQLGGNQLAVEHVHLAADRLDVAAKCHSPYSSR